MQHKVILFILLLIASAMSKADSIIYCPSVSDIKANQLASWLPLYKDGEELASPQDVENFKAHVFGFAFSNWNPYYLESAHCFYRGDDPITDQIILAHDAYRPADNMSWHWLSYKEAMCETGEAACGFRL